MDSPETTASHPSWDELRAFKIVSGMVKKHRGLFAAFPEFDRDDLISEGLIAARAAWPAYDCWKSAASNFIFRVAHRHLISKYRSVNAERIRERKVSRLRPEAGKASFNDLMIAQYDPTRTLAEWLVIVYAGCRKAFPRKKFHQGRRYYNLAQLAAIAALMQRTKMSIRACEWTLSQREDLRMALNLKRPPKRHSIHNGMKALKLFLKGTAAPEQKRLEVGTHSSGTNSAEVGTEN